MKITEDNDLELVAYKDFFKERQVELDITISTGKYIILPRTSGAKMKKPSNYSG